MTATSTSVTVAPLDRYAHLNKLLPPREVCTTESEAWRAHSLDSPLSSPGVSATNPIVQKTNSCGQQLIDWIRSPISSKKLSFYTGTVLVTSTLGAMALTIGLKAFILGSLAIAFGISPIGWIAAGGALLLLGLALIGRMICASPPLAKTGIIESKRAENMSFKNPWNDEIVNTLWNAESQRGFFTFIDGQLVTDFNDFAKSGKLTDTELNKVRRLTSPISSKFILAAPILAAQSLEHPGDRDNGLQFIRGLPKAFHVNTSEHTVTMNIESRLIYSKENAMYAEDIAYLDQITINYCTNKYTITRTPVAVNKEIWGNTPTDLEKNRTNFKGMSLCYIKWIAKCKKTNWDDASVEEIRVKELQDEAFNAWIEGLAQPQSTSISTTSWLKTIQNCYPRSLL